MMKHTPNPLADLATLADAPREELAALQSLSTVVRLTEGTVLMLEGAFGNEAHILIEGELLVERNGDAVAELSPGAVVGEHAVLLKEARNATVTAATDVVVAVMDRREFTSLLDRCPTIARLILTTALARSGSVN